MRNFSKTLISMAAVMAVGSAMAAGAMADELSATYNADAGTVTLSNFEGTGTSQTLLVVKGEDVTITNENADECIVQIDQVDNTSADSYYFGTEAAPIQVGTLEEGATYEVRAGGLIEGSIQTCTFTVSSKEPEVETTEITIGDIDLNNSLDTLDLNYLKRKTTQKRAKDGFAYAGQTRNYVDDTTITIGDIDLNNSLDTLDLNYLKRKTTQKRAKDGFAYAGQTRTIKK